MTYLEKAQSLTPDRPSTEIIFEECPLDFFLIPLWKHRDFCLSGKNCATCWNREYKEEQPR